MNLPERLGKYRITEVLGEGAMGIVYKGFDPDIQREVAIKTLRGGGDESAGHGVSYADRFRNEAQAGGRLQHPGIVAVYEYGQHGDLAFIAMEYVRGHTLSRYLQQAAAGRLTLSDDDVHSIIGQLLDALHHAHAQGVWHRDIKPSNLIVTANGKIKVADFGIARIEAAGLTQVVSMIGTPMYMAPEQFQGLAIDRRVDLYATGVVLYQLLTGQLPFTGSAESLMYRVVHEVAAPPSALAGMAHRAAYDALLARALAKDPAHRFADAMQFRDALSALLGRGTAAEVSDVTIVSLSPLLPRAAREPLSGAAPSAAMSYGSQLGAGSGPPSAAGAFTPAELAMAESSLARYVGPMAKLLVRRATRSCADLPSLYAHLAEQVSDTTARRAFAQQVSHLTASAVGDRSTGTRQNFGQSSGARDATVLVQAPSATPRSLGPAAGASGGPITPALLELATKLLVNTMGPIAAVMVKKAAAAAHTREAFGRRLADLVDDPELRVRLLDALARATH